MRFRPAPALAGSAATTPETVPDLDLDDVRRRLTAAFPLVDDHPDVAGVLRDPALLALLGPALAQPFLHEGVTLVMAPEARGPILGALVAIELGAGLVLARRAGANHPGADLQVRSDPTWRGDRQVFQGRSMDLVPSDRVLIVDDWITTGASARAVAALARRRGATVVGVAALVNKATLAVLDELGAHTLVDFDAIAG